MLLSLDKLEMLLDLFFVLIRIQHLNLEGAMPDFVCKWIWTNHLSPQFVWADWFKESHMKVFQHFISLVAVWVISVILACTISNLLLEKK